MTRLAVLGALLAAALVAVPAASPAPTGQYTAVALAMVRSDVPSVEAYFSDHGTYAGITVAKLRAYDRTLSTVEIARASRSGYCLQANVLGSWAHFAAGDGHVKSGPC